MKIGVWLSSSLTNISGGAFSYTDKLINALDNYTFDESVEILFVGIRHIECLKREYKCVSQIPSVLYSIFNKSKTVISFLERLDRFLIRKKGLKKVLKGANIKIIMYIRQGFCVDPTFPFVSINWDIGHRSTFAFPEINNEFVLRDVFYQSILPQALLVACDSETGKKELLSYTNIGEHKIEVLPIFAGGVSEIELDDNEINAILHTYDLEREKFFFYPAQFWAHKNHVGLIKAFEHFSKNVQGYKLVLCGTDKGNRKHIEQLVKDNGLIASVIFLGFIPEQHLAALYRGATSLIMASHFGPTNMPPIEAMECGCPVLCTDLGGHREILGDNAMYFNSFDHEELSKKMIQIISDRALYVHQILSQKQSTDFNFANSMNRLNSILKKAVLIRENWD